VEERLQIMDIGQRVLAMRSISDGYVRRNDSRLRPFTGNGGTKPPGEGEHDLSAQHHGPGKCSGGAPTRPKTSSTTTSASNRRST
jgi:hypothetical protein